MNNKSVFEEFETSPLLIKKFEQYDHNIYFKYQNANILIESELFNENNNIEICKYYRIQNRKLYVFENNSSILPGAYYDLMIFPKISKIIIKENSNLKFSFKLSKFNEEIFFYHSKKSIILNWIQVLKCYCISEDFHQSYYVLERLGSGHFGQVFKVENIIRKELFAAKILTKNYDFDKKKKYVYKEVLILKKLPKHENIIKLYEIYETDLDIILIFQLMTGGDLYSKFKKSYSFDEQEACYIFCNLLRGVKFLHSHGIAHRDIKPENILLSKNRKIIKLADFGLADQFTNNIFNVKCGTPGYMAPEIFNNKEYDEKSDIFSLGIMLYMILVGFSPFKGKAIENVIENNKLCKIKYGKKWKHISKEGKDLVKKMVKKNPDQRISLIKIKDHVWIRLFGVNTIIKNHKSLKAIGDLNTDLTDSNEHGLSENEAYKSYKHHLIKHSILASRYRLSKQNNLSQKNSIIFPNFKFSPELKTVNSFLITNSLESETMTGNNFSMNNSTDNKQRSQISFFSKNSSFNSYIHNVVDNIKSSIKHEEIKENSLEEDYSHEKFPNCHKTSLIVFPDENPILNLIKKYTLYENE